MNRQNGNPLKCCVRIVVNIMDLKGFWNHSVQSLVRYVPVGVKMTFFWLEKREVLPIPNDLGNRFLDLAEKLIRCRCTRMRH
jgi:hypothetical protein